MFEQTFKNIDDILHKDAGATSELDYTEQTSWILFLKYLDALEQTKAMEADLEGKAYQFIIDAAYRWPTWAAPKTADGKFDHNNALTGDDLKDFVNLKLFPYLKGFKQRATGPNTIEYKIGGFLVRLTTKFKAATTCVRWLSALMSLALTPKQKSMSYRTYMKLRLRTWAMQAVTAANITRPAR